ncbi:adenosylcobinamide-phosphate synthase CbiB [Marinobacterium sp. D7]|uniref:adenosylcobinamide-phosphate synthase CbiB n=1 Tax=Marinobacterium ramblicola TaxID=2849041 RepID=UPI001C2D5068|nr:adenosylcobinamide-phosphate synthase CbiB [Marinobacterium ramblicola]MBV1788461.1 adenosylcobinamide-phosphate synthase CbiB [Marinobacterium ramblicola]
MSALMLVAGVLLDLWWGEPRRWHPLVGFGRCARWIEQRLNRGDATGRRLLGLIAVLLLVVPPVLLCVWLVQQPSVGWLISVLVLWFALGLNSLRAHTLPIMTALSAGDLAEARRLTARICSRDEAWLEIERSAVESILENGSDAVFGALFWFCVAGAPGVLAFRLINTLDASWGYKSERFLHFGWAAARLDDLVGLIPARLTALAYALCGDTRRALSCWRLQASAHDSPNAGPVMASGAGALGVRLGGLTCYRGVWIDKPCLGKGAAARRQDLQRALDLVGHSVVLWLAAILLMQLILETWS